MLFPKTERTSLDLSLTIGLGDPFDDITLENIQTQTKQYEKPKPNYALLGLIPLGIVAYLMVRK